MTSSLGAYIALSLLTLALASCGGETETDEGAPRPRAERHMGLVLIPDPPLALDHAWEWLCDEDAGSCAWVLR